MMKEIKSRILQFHTGIKPRKLVLSFLVIMSAWIAVIPPVSAQDLTAPTLVVTEYLNSLANGDTQKLVQLIDGRMKQSNRQLVLNPESYSEFLKGSYAGVQMTIEDIAPDGTRIRARVRFDYPSQDSSIIEFLLTETNGVWKITDEVY